MDVSFPARAPRTRPAPGYRRGAMTARAARAPLAAAWLLLALASASPAGEASTVLVVGDSLATGLEPSLPALVAPRTLVWDADAGRTTPEGLLRLRAELRSVTPRAVLISLGTNDGPRPGRFRDRVRRALRAIPTGVCVVWADLHRPARKGPYRRLNAVLRGEARRDPRLVVVRWSRAVDSGRVTLPDGIHPDGPGFAYRSRMYARALLNGCRRTG
jgi:GDSL-like Lipase/Acylhydrolase family